MNEDTTETVSSRDDEFRAQLARAQARRDENKRLLEVRRNEGDDDE